MPITTEMVPHPTDPNGEPVTKIIAKGENDALTLYASIFAAVARKEPFEVNGVRYTPTSVIKNHPEAYQNGLQMLHKVGMDSFVLNRAEIDGKTWTEDDFFLITFAQAIAEE